MNYQKVVITIQPDNQEIRDILVAKLSELNYASFIENEETVEAYIPFHLFEAKVLEQLKDESIFDFSIETEFIEDQNWNEVWEKNYFKPLLIAGQCLIRAPFHTDYPEAKYEIVIEPKMAFGTGNHETTALMIEHILELNLENKIVLDMGCGTGILSMLASKTKALSVLAIDIDKWSYDSTIENSAINKCNNISVLHGDASLLGNQQFDVIIANIHKNILLEDMPKYVSVLKPNGLLLLSGFYETDLDDMNNKALHLGLKPLTHKSQNKWVAAKYQK